jgi:GTP diphosphokinase / guanosine-3',5'-bis(diphosphate) 3'-diphosphatase
MSMTGEPMADQSRAADPVDPDALRTAFAIVAELTPRGGSQGLLHDTLEDAATSFEELEREFGADVAGLVDEATDNKGLEKAKRKRLQIEAASSKSPRARLIKIADRTSNLRSMLASPPADWSVQRKHEYFVRAAEVVAPCRGINPQLEASFDRAYAEGMTAVFRGNRKRP